MHSLAARATTRDASGTMPLKDNPPPRSLQELGDSASRDEPSITEVNGKIARARFEMAFSPPEDVKFVFGPPRSQLLPSLGFLLFGCCVFGLVVAAYASGSNTRLHIWLIEGDRDRMLPSWILATIVFVSSIAVVARARMRGVTVTAEGIETRTLLAMGVPKVTKWAWAQVDRFVIDERRILVELWNGSSEFLPEVAKTQELAALLEKIAIGKKKDVTRLRAR
jgi:hypothetical protein